jgi:hypothetical protein
LSDGDYDRLLSDVGDRRGTKAAGVARAAGSIRGAGGVLAVFAAGRATYTRRRGVTMANSFRGGGDQFREHCRVVELVCRAGR